MFRSSIHRFCSTAREFVSTGAIFWPDVLDVSKDNPIWRELDLPAVQRTSFETGQIVIDKGRHGAALKTVLRLNEEAERYYRLVYGDKDTFLAAWLLADAPHQLVPYRPIADRHVLYQRDFGGRIVFQHRTNGKWKYGGEQARSEGFVNGEACEQALAALRRIWNGRIFEPPVQIAGGHAHGTVDGRPHIRGRAPRAEDRQFELLAHCQIGKGRDFEHETWYVVEPDDRMLRAPDHGAVINATWNCCDGMTTIGPKRAFPTRRRASPLPDGDGRGFRERREMRSDTQSAVRPTSLRPPLNSEVSGT